MRVNGKTVINDNIELLVIPRKSGDLAFKFRPVIDHSEFDNYVKEPTPPTITMAGGSTALDLEDKDYQKKQIDYYNKKSNWLFIQSMLATDGLEFELIKLNDPDTWDKMDEELKKAEFTVAERNRMYLCYRTANSLNDDVLDEARDSFLASTQAE